MTVGRNTENKLLKVADCRKFGMGIEAIADYLGMSNGRCADTCGQPDGASRTSGSGCCEIRCCGQKWSTS